MSGNDFDVVVLGAGAVGAVCATALKDSGLRVALIDAGAEPPAPPPDHYDLRVSAVSPASRLILEAVGAWSLVDAGRIEAYESMFVWDSGGDGSIRFEAAELGEPNLGYIVENANVQHALIRTALGAANIECRFEASPVRLEPGPAGCRLELDNGDVVRAGLVVGADGARSWVRRQLEIPVSSRLYGQRALVCEVATERPHQHTAWQRFLPTGPVAFLPLANGHSSVVWTCDAALAEEVECLPAGAFAGRLEQAFASRLGGVELRSAVAGFDLTRRRASRYVAERAALIGDAAHVVHPLAGQGANLGMADAWSLAGVVSAAAGAGRDFGRRHVLRRYERRRRSESWAMLQMLDLLHGLFSTDLGPVRAARSIGLRAVDRREWLKEFFARQALGAAPRAALPAGAKDASACGQQGG